MDNKDMENSSASLDDILNSIPDDKTGPEEVRNEPEALTEENAEQPAADTEICFRFAAYNNYCRYFSCLCRVYT